jgi:hypothetical protein
MSPDAPAENPPVADEASPTPAPLSWRVFRARETPVRTLFVTLFVIAVLVIALAYYGLAMCLVALLVLFLALNSYYLPTTYTLNEKGITTDKLLFHYTRGWNEFRSHVRTSGGVVVSPFRNWTYLDNFRGIHLLLPRDPKPVLDYLAQRLPEKKKTRKNPNQRPNQS